MSDLTYICSPYNSPDPGIKHARFRAVCKVAAALMARGELVFSPIAHTHPIALAGSLPPDWGFWERYDRAMLEACGMVYVLMLPGWRESIGVQAEIKIAAELGIDVRYLEPADFGV